MQRLFCEGKIMDNFYELRRSAETIAYYVALASDKFNDDCNAELRECLLHIVRAVENTQRRVEKLESRMPRDFSTVGLRGARAGAKE